MGTDVKTVDNYLKLLEDNLLGLHTPVTYREIGHRYRAISALVSFVGRLFRKNLCLLVRTSELAIDVREKGDDWPTVGETMIGRQRLQNIRMCVQTVIQDQVPGDLIECGVWRGGAGIYMRALLDAFGDTGRKVWLADSFEGLPPPTLGSAKEDAGDTLWTKDALRVSLEEVRDNFAKYGLLDERVSFIKGWFEETLIDAPIQQIAVLRADGDMFSSTWSTLTALEPRVPSGGFVIIDDYYGVPGSQKAVNKYRAEHNISAPLEKIDWTGVYWRKP